MDRIGGDIVEIKDELKAITSGMDKIVRLEVHHENQEQALERAFGTIRGLEGRMKTLEAQEPINKMVSNWVISGVLGIIGLIGLQVVGLVFILKDKPAAQQPVHITIDRSALEREEPRR
jgi:hypothetical protein